MQVRKTRWSKVYESSEEELVAFLQARNESAEHWTATEFEQLAEQHLGTDSTVYLAEGSANFAVNGQSYSMQPGDAISMAAGTTFQVTAGMAGCICYQSRRNIATKRPS